MKHRRHAEVYDECWKIPVCIIWDISNDEFVKFVKQHFGCDVPDMHTGAGLYTSLTSEEGLVGLIAMGSGPFSGTPYQYAILAHECMHAAFHILKSRGIRYNKNSEEAFTYFADSLIERLATAMLKKEARLV